MKTKHIITALLATAGLAVGTHAYGSVVAAEPDLLLGFQQAGNTTDYEADLGSMSNYIGLAPNTIKNLSADISAADLNGLFGSTFTGGTVTWGAVATVGAGATTLNGVSVPAKSTFITQFDSIATGLAPSLTPPSSQFKDAATATSNTRYLAIQGVYTPLNGAASASTPNAALIAASASNSWSKWANGQGVNAFGNGIDAPTALSLSAGQYSVVDLFQYGVGTTSTPGTYIGSLELSSTGGLWFTNYVPTVVPEPSTYAALIGVAVLGFAMLRRKQATV